MFDEEDLTTAGVGLDAKRRGKCKGHHDPLLRRYYAKKKTTYVNEDFEQSGPFIGGASCRMRSVHLAYSIQVGASIRADSLAAGAFVGTVQIAEGHTSITLPRCRSPTIPRAFLQSRGCVYCLCEATLTVCVLPSIALRCDGLSRQESGQ